jgi:hypothetical protein
VQVLVNTTDTTVQYRKSRGVNLHNTGHQLCFQNANSGDNNAIPYGDDLLLTLNTCAGADNSSAVTTVRIYVEAIVSGELISKLVSTVSSPAIPQSVTVTAANLASIGLGEVVTIKASVFTSASMSTSATYTGTVVQHPTSQPSSQPSTQPSSKPTCTNSKLATSPACRELK